MPLPSQPNILIFMVDQLNGTLFPGGRPAEFLHAPTLKALSEKSARFNRNYTASPLCGPGRASFMSGCLPSGTGVYDNAAEFASSIPTYAHHLRGAGWQTILSGKMHFVGADQLHGFEERLTTDIYPADFGWTPDYRRPGQRIDWWYHNLGSVTTAGIAEITNQLEYDDEVAHFACQKLYQLARTSDAPPKENRPPQEHRPQENRPWCLTVSFTHPHDPYVARRRYWDLYADCPALDPEIPPLDFASHDPHAMRLYIANDYQNFNITPENVRRSRRAYFANISYLDEKIGEVLDVLRRTRMGDNTVIIFCSDHGDMLGERGLWFKMSFREGSARTPLLISAPGQKPCQIDQPVSNLDILPTLCSFAGIDISAHLPYLDGYDLRPIISGEAVRPPICMEYAAEGSYAPMVCMVDGAYKYISCALDPDQMFDLDADPHEQNNLAPPVPDSPASSHVSKRAADLQQAIRDRWDLSAFDESVRLSQARRLTIYEALRHGTYFPWDYQPLQKASERYMRNHLDLNILEESQRFPRGE